MPLGSARLTLFAKPAEVAAEARPLSITANNSAQVDTAEWYFGGASLLTDRTNPDWIDVDNSAGSLDLGSGDWTIEFFMRPTALPGAGGYHFIYDSRSAGSTVAPSIGLTNAKVFFYTAGGFRITGSTTVSTNTWYHVALVKNSGTTTLYLNGTSDGTYADSNTYIADDSVHIGANFAGANGFTGNLDEFRVSSTARYTGSFTVPTQIFYSDADTLLLIHSNGADATTTFTDDTTEFTGLTVTPTGDVEKDTAFVKYGTACAEFGNTTRDGELTVSKPTTEIAQYRTGDWTWECWAHVDADESSQTFMTTRSDTSYNNGDLTVYRVGPAPFNDQVRFFGKDSTGTSFSINGSTTLMSSLDTWYHIAAQRYNGDFELFVNGISQGTTSGLSGDLYYSAVQASGQNDVYLGSLGSATTQGLNGGMDEVRISSIARYTSGNFTPPTGAFTRDEHTVFLMHADGTDGATDFEDSLT